MSGLSRTAPQPLYHQLKLLILRQIEAGKWKPGDQLPTEDELAGRFQVSKITVRHALRELSGQGYIRREQGRGTFVERPRMQQGPRELTSFTDEMRRHGLVSRSRVLEQGIIAAPAASSTPLAIREGAPVFRLRRLRLADGQPMAVQTAFLPIDLVPGIDRMEFADASLYEILQSRYSLNPASARETYRVVVLDREEAELLDVRTGSPGMGVERVTSLADGRPLEYVESVMRSDRYTVVVELTTLR
jgi:GntR family transcriptional regulator, N-acetylglucosamine utilization regulator